MFLVIEYREYQHKQEIISLLLMNLKSTERENIRQVTPVYNV